MKNSIYTLRRAVVPWNTDEQLADLISFCRSNSIDEVMAFVDSEEFSHAIPTVEWLTNYLPVLREMKSRLTDIGVLFSINPWVTLHHCDRGRNLKTTHPDVDLMVGHDGVQCKACACPLSPGWRKLTRELWSLYASLEPHVLWVEDDIRLLNHPPVEYGCFCDIHIKEFSERIGEQVTRENLVGALLAPGEPHPWRAIWLEMNRELANETVAFLEQIVHKVSPNTRLGLMCSTPTSHSIEGRNWSEFTSALAGDKPLHIRPCLLNYTEDSLRGLYQSEYCMRAVMQYLSANAIVQTEVENFPFSAYSKSTKFTFLQCALSCIFGADGVTLSISDHMGTPLESDPSIGEMLRVNKPFFSALIDSCREGNAKGIGLIHAEDGTRHVHLKPDSNWRGLCAGGDAWRKVLEALGYAVSYGKSETYALSGQVVRSLSDERIRQILSGGVILDLSALQCLLEMGYGEYVGCGINRLYKKSDEPIAAEEYFDEDFGGSPRTYMTLTLPDLSGDAVMAELKPMPGARVVSRVVNPDAEPVYPFLITYENELGGRIAIYPIDIDYCAGNAFLGLHRKRQIDFLISWLSQNQEQIAVDGGVYPLPFLIDKADTSIVGAFNLSQDEWPNVTIQLSPTRHPKEIRILSEKGGWHSDPSIECILTGTRLKLVLNRPLPAASLVVVQIGWGPRS